MARLSDEARGLGRALLDAVLPLRCLGCGGIVEGPDGGAVCPPCWTRLRFLGPPQCDVCGRPFEYAVEGGPGVCGQCLATPPAYARCRAALAYDDASRPLVLGFKHRDAIHAAPAFAAWLARAGAELCHSAELLVPVPLHRWRLLGRRYNQAAVLARALGRRVERAVVPDLLARRRATPSQGRLSRSGRRRNVARAFAVRPSRLALVPSRRILLIDDVLTTGATAEECARVLKRAGAEAVDVLTLALVVRD